LTVWNRLLRTLAAVTASSAVLIAVMLALLRLRLFTAFPRPALLLDWGITLAVTAGIRLLIDWLAERKPAASVKPLQVLRQYGPTWLKEGSLYFGIIGLVLVSYMGWNYLQFGTPTPVSGQIKEWWGALGDTIYGKPIVEPLIFFGFDPAIIRSPWRAALSLFLAPVQANPGLLFPIFGVIYTLIGLALLKVKKAAVIEKVEGLGLLPLLVGCFIQIWTYNARAYVAMRSWYWVAQLVLTCLMAGLLLDSICKLIPWLRLQRVAPFALFVILGALSLGSFGKMMVDRFTPSEAGSDRAAMMRDVQILEETTPPGSVIGMTGGGTTSYFLRERTIVNLDGLINSYAYFKAMQDYQSADYLDAIGLDYIYGNSMIVTESIPYQQEFQGWLTPVQSFGVDVLYKFQRTSQP